MAVMGRTVNQAILVDNDLEIRVVGVRGTHVILGLWSKKYHRYQRTEQVEGYEEFRDPPWDPEGFKAEQEREKSEAKLKAEDERQAAEAAAKAEQSQPAFQPLASHVVNSQTRRRKAESTNA